MADTESQITPSDLSVVSTIADADKIMVTHSNGTTEVIQGTKLKDFIKTIDNANALAALDTSKTNPVNSSAVNSAIAALNVVASTPTLTLDSARWGTYTINYVKMQRVGDIYICFGSVTVGADAGSGNLYIRVNDTFDRTSGWRIDSKWETLNDDTYSGMLYSTANNSLWLKKGYSTVESSTNNVKGTELAGKTVTFMFIASKFTF